MLAVFYFREPGQALAHELQVYAMATLDCLMVRKYSNATMNPCYVKWARAGGELIVLHDVDRQPYKICERLSVSTHEVLNSIELEVSQFDCDLSAHGEYVSCFQGSETVRNSLVSFHALSSTTGEMLLALDPRAWEWHIWHPLCDDLLAAMSKDCNSGACIVHIYSVSSGGALSSHNTSLLGCTTVQAWPADGPVILGYASSLYAVAAYFVGSGRSSEMLGEVHRLEAYNVSPDGRFVAYPCQLAVDRLVIIKVSKLFTGKVYKVCSSISVDLAPHSHYGQWVSAWAPNSKHIFLAHTAHATPFGTMNFHACPTTRLQPGALYVVSTTSWQMVPVRNEFSLSRWVMEGQLLCLPDCCTVLKPRASEASESHHAQGYSLISFDC